VRSDGAPVISTDKGLRGVDGLTGSSSAKDKGMGRKGIMVSPVLFNGGAAVGENRGAIGGHASEMRGW
jgi:hypothetical protein